MHYQVLFIFGKHLDKNHITREFAARIDFVIYEVEQGRLNPDAIFFSGGKTNPKFSSEAEIGLAYLINKIGTGKYKRWSSGFELTGFELFSNQIASIKINHKPILISALSEAKDTVETFEEICRELKNNGINPDKAQIIWITTDYHVKHLLYMHHTLPYASLIQAISEYVEKMIPLSVPYPRKGMNSLEKWRLTLYITAYNMIPLWVELFRLDGCFLKKNLTINEGNLFKAVPDKDGWVVFRNGLTLEQIPSNLHQTYKLYLQARNNSHLLTLERTKKMLKRFQQILGQRPDKLEPWLKSNIDELKLVCQLCEEKQGKLNNPVIREQLAIKWKPTKKAIDELKLLTDPDKALQKVQ